MRLLVLLLALLPSLALAGDWSDANLVRGESSFHDVAQDSVVDPGRLGAVRCGRSSWVRLVPQISDTTGKALNGITIDVYACTQPAGTDAAGCRQLYDKDEGTGTLNGDEEANRAAMYGSLGTWVFIDILTAPTSGAARIEISCQ